MNKVEVVESNRPAPEIREAMNRLFHYFRPDMTMILNPLESTFSGSMRKMQEYLLMQIARRRTTEYTDDMHIVVDAYNESIENIRMSLTSNCCSAKDC